MKDNQDVLSKDILYGGRQYLLVARRGHKFNMQYATLIPMETMWKDMGRAQLGLGLFLFALSIPCMVLTIYFSRRHTKPIKELRYLFSTTVPGKDDFEAIQSGIEELVDRNEDLNTRLDQSLPARKANFIKDFVKDRYPSRKDAVKAAAQLDMNIDKACFAVSLLGAPVKDASLPNMEKVTAF